MEIAIEKMNLIDRELAAEWMSRRCSDASGTPLAFPADILPATGLTAWEENKPVAVATLCLEQSSPVAVCGFCIANPENPPRVSHAAVRLLLADMGNYARECGAKYLITTFGNHGINSFLGKLGFLEAEAMQSFFKILR